MRSDRRTIKLIQAMMPLPRTRSRATCEHTRSSSDLYLIDSGMTPVQYSHKFVTRTSETYCSLCIRLYGMVGRFELVRSVH